MDWDDSTRFPRPKEITNEVLNAFSLLYQLDDALEAFHNKFYSKNLKDEYFDKIKALKQNITAEVFELMEEKHIK